MYLPESEVLLEIGSHHAHRAAVLLHYALTVIVEVVCKQGISERCRQLPLRDVEFTENLCRGGLAEVVVPSEVVREQILLIEVRLLKSGLKMNFKVYRAIFIPSERVEAELHICVHAEVVDFISGKRVSSRRVPFDIALDFSVRPGIDIRRVQVCVFQFSGNVHVRIEAVV